MRYKELKDRHVYVNGRAYPEIDGKLLMRMKELAQNYRLPISRVKRLADSGRLKKYIFNGRPKSPETQETVYINVYEFKSLESMK